MDHSIHPMEISHAYICFDRPGRPYSHVSARPWLTRLWGGAKINYRADLQQERIDQGIENGSLTYREALRLQKQQKYINSIIRLAERDGIVTIRESRIIEREQEQGQSPDPQPKA